MRKPIFIILGVILSFTLSLGLFFSLLGADIPAKESSWEVVKGKNKVSDFEVITWFDLPPRFFSVQTNKKEIFFAPSSQFYVAPWTPPGKKEGKYVWKLNLNTFSTEPILYEKFLALKPELPGQLTAPLVELVKQQIKYDLAKKAPSGESVIEVIGFNTNNKNYEVKLSVSDFKSLKRRRFGTDYMEKKFKGWHTVIYYSGIMHLQIFDLAKPMQPLVELKKSFKDWDYPIKSQGKKFTRPSIISSFCKLYFLPDSRPCVMLSSPVYQGRVYQHKNRVGDETFSLIIT
jgi:hypothetical protein